MSGHHNSQSDSLGRAFPACSYMALKAAFRRLTKTVGGQESAASITRVDYQRIGRYGRAHEPMFAPIDVVADLESDAGCPMVTRAMADLQGYLLIPKPPTTGDAQWVEHLGAGGGSRRQGPGPARIGRAVRAPADDGDYGHGRRRVPVGAGAEESP